MATTRLVLIEDHPALREGLALLLARHGIEVVGTAADARTGYALIDALAPDLAVVDVDLGRGGDGVALTRSVVEGGSACRVVLYTGTHDPEVMMAGLEAGASGFALKQGRIEDLLAAIDVVLAGHTYVDPRLRDDVPPIRASFATPVVVEPPRVLSKREREVMGLLASGLTGEQMAERLFLSAETVKTHVRNAMTKLGATTRVHAVAIALRDGEISLATTEVEATAVERHAPLLRPVSA